LTVYEHSFALSCSRSSWPASLSTRRGRGGVQPGTVGPRPAGGSVGRFLTTSQFWFQSFQNWQSEFFVVGAVALLGIRLRERGSPESKPVATLHDQTGAS
jgi:hypothetical protein